MVLFRTLLIIAVFGMQGCLEAPSFLKDQNKSSSGTNFGAITSEKKAEVKSDEEGVVVAVLDPASSQAQAIEASGDSAVKGSEVVFPPGALSVASEITLEQGADLSGEDQKEELAKIGLDETATVTAASPALVITSSVPTDASEPFTLSIVLDDGTSLTQNEQELVILYKVYKAALGELVLGIIPNSDLVIKDGKVSFDTTFFGSFQAIYTDVVIEAPVEAETEAPIVTQQEIIKNPPAVPTKLVIAADAADGAAATLDNDTKLFLRWKATTGATSYDLLTYNAKDCAGTGAELAGVTKASTEFTAKTGVRTSFKVRANGEGGSSEYSVCSAAILVDTTAPKAATSLKILDTKASTTAVTLEDDTTIYLSFTSGSDSGSGLSGEIVNVFGSTDCSGTAVKKVTAAVSPVTFTGTNGSRYSFKVDTVDAAGNKTSSSCSGSVTIDTSGPTVASVTPADGSTGISRSSSISVVFSENINSSTITSTSVTLTKVSTGDTVPVTMSYSGTTLTIDPDSTLSMHSQFRVTIGSGVKDLAGNSVAATTSDFTTQDGTWVTKSTSGNVYWSSDLGFDVNGAGDAAVTFKDNNGDLRGAYFSGASRVWGLTSILDNEDTFIPDESVVKIDNSGNASAFWLQEASGVGNKVYSNTYVPGSSWQGTPTIMGSTSLNTSEHPVMAKAPNGDIMAAWVLRDTGSTPNNLYSVRRNNSSASWDSVLPVATSQGSGNMKPQILANDDSGAAFWLYSSSGIGGNYYNGTSWGSTTDVDQGNNFVSSFNTAMNQAGDATAIWVQNSSDVKSNTYNSSGSLMGVTSHEDIIQQSATPKLGVNMAGDIHGVWLKQVSGAETSMRHAELPAAGSWQAPSNIATNMGFNVSKFNMYIGKNGKGAAIWVDGTTGHDVYASTYDGTNWSTATQLDNDNTEIDGPDVVVDDDGNAMAVWLQASSGVGYYVRANRFAGNWSATPTNVAFLDYSSYPPTIGMDDDGRVLGVWIKEASGSIHTFISNAFE